MKRTSIILIVLLIGHFLLPAQQAYFIDGYHGGIYGHLPGWQTRFMVDKLRQFPAWKINLELEPESWDSIAERDPEAYHEFAKIFEDQSSRGRVEYINPTYGQSYLYNISGESIIRQFSEGMAKLKHHFPQAVFTTYSSEEPCFTSALPQILKSFGFIYASLKNPETCWGGYTRAYGGELVNWIGPDGSSLVTVPRYEVESLKPGSTWETIACNNSVSYIQRSFQYGILHPVGMCLQDAGWTLGPDRNGPWIRPAYDSLPAYMKALARNGLTSPGQPGDDINNPYMQTAFETWRGYIENRSIRHAAVNWHFTQEDVLVSLEWGGQILQRIAQQVRAAENKIITAEKMASLAAVFGGRSWPGSSLQEAWRTLLLSQHHDCWIVPYNPVADRPGDAMTWAAKVAQWTAHTTRICDSIINRSLSAWSRPSLPAAGLRQISIRLFNTNARTRIGVTTVKLPAGWKGAVVRNSQNKVVAGQLGSGSGTTGEDQERTWVFQAKIPGLGYADYLLEQRDAPDPVAGSEPPGIPRRNAASVYLRDDQKYQLQTDLYTLIIDPAHGGAIISLIARKLHGLEFVNPKSPVLFGELRGNFYQEGGFHSSTESPAQITVLENGPVRLKLEIRGKIAGTGFTEMLTVAEGQSIIDMDLSIDWKHNTGLGRSPESLAGHPREKSFYNDSFKLQARFPLNLKDQRVYRNAPYDVFRSRMSHTFFDRWDSIKNVVLLNWVDVEDHGGQAGMALFTDHTTSYSHGAGYPLGLTLQYAGTGIFWHNYELNGPSQIHYALLPHGGKWDQAGIWSASCNWNEPMVSLVGPPAPGVFPNSQAIPAASRSLLELNQADWEVSAIYLTGQDLCVRLFNAEGSQGIHRIYPGFSADGALLIALDGHVLKRLELKKDKRGKTYTELRIPRFGIRTLRFLQARGRW